MSIQHTNRMGDIYFLQAGKTRTGRPRYWFGRKLTGQPVETLPAGYEIYEEPERGQVLLRKARPTEISPLERELVVEGIRRCAGLEHFIVDVDENCLVVYLPGMSEDGAARLFAHLAVPTLAAWPQAEAAKAGLIQASGYVKTMRFGLCDADECWFVAQRWCFRDSIDDWIYLGGPAPLADLVEKYGRHLGKESFYEL